MATILLIDDDRAALDTFRVALAISHFDVVTAESGTQGIEIAIALQPDVILSDLRLPDVSGIEVLRRLREMGTVTPFVMMTAFGTAPSAVEAMRLGANDYLEKPISVERFMETIGRALWEAPLASRPSVSPGAAQHALKRWASAIVTVLNSPTDPKTLRGWASCAAASPGTLRNWCRTANLSTRNSLWFARLLRSVVRFHAYGDFPENSLDVVDTRTLSHLLSRSGTDWQPRSEAPTLRDFLHHQKLIENVRAVEQVWIAMGSAARDKRTEGLAFWNPESDSTHLMAMRRAFLPLKKGDAT